jgi:hypothetical protein
LTNIPFEHVNRQAKLVIVGCDWLDQAYEQMRSGTASLLGKLPPAEATPQSVSARLVASIDRDSPAKIGKATPKSDAIAPHFTGEVARLISEVRKAGYELTNETKKLAEFESPAGQAIYLVKTTSRLNSINLMVHPGLSPETLHRLDGVDCISTGHRFHSNMTRFPKRIHGGKTETAYGWQVQVDTISNLPRFLAAFESIGFGGVSSGRIR